ncbi:dimethylmenaquinone methyltransferase [Bacterioplanes sanyensis]|uniref:TraR/DksA family transcriptional regulator n=1 Tax=Bacterioplanes sanyensis TaxID=1249553 RepID=UPI0016727EA0|nr:TraR/DksA family transcriptional regulator [Bacterioplanes sanyensis]GGY52051.1 dimethylmenaquinone methyltransferase [Bacterioplanes sanyensis]
MSNEAIRQQLLERRQQLAVRADKTERDASHRDEPLSSDFAEQAVERENDEVLSAISLEARHEITLIDKALRRIDAGQYGVCEHCGENIDERRLQAVPYAELCIQCASKADQL